MKKLFKTLVVMALVAGLVMVAGCGSGKKDAEKTSGDKKMTVTVGSKNFSESLIIGEMIAQLMEDQGIPVERKLNINGTKLLHEAMLKGDIDIYPEYDGTGLMYILKMPQINDTEEILKAVQKGYKEKFNLIWLNQAPMNNSNILVTTKEVAEKYNLKTLSDVAKAAPNLVIAVPPEFTERADGMQAMKNTYGGCNFKEVKKIDVGLKYKGLLDKQYDVTVGFGTDGQIAGYNLVPLKDDKNCWPPYHVGAVLRPEVLENYPQLEEQLNKLFSLLTDEVMVQLNWKVDGDAKMEPAEVARQFLKENKLIK